MTRRSNFYRPSSIDAEAIKRNALKDQGILVVSVNHPDLTWDQREILKQVGRKIYQVEPCR